MQWLEPLERVWFSPEILADPDQAVRARLILVACMISALPAAHLRRAPRPPRNNLHPPHHRRGTTSCGQIREFVDPSAHTAIMAVTGRIDVDAAQLRGLGFDALLLKPIRREDLLRHLRELGF